MDRLGIAFTLGSLNGIAINTAHEMGHKKEHLERWFARIALAPSGYGHFFIEHNRGHHVRVATPDDPASSRLGESFWAFWPRTVSGSVRNSWELEKRRLRRMGKRTWTPRNDVLNAWAMTVVLWAVLIVLFGVGIVPYLLLQAVFAFSLLEAVNYLEHYGLLRESLPNGRYERVTPRHSWNNNHIVTNLFLYHLQRHSDHHANPTRRYQALRHFEESPQLPSGYAAMIVLCYFPPLWRRVMDKRVLAHYDGDVTRANIHPRKRAAIIAKYGTPEAGMRERGGLTWHSFGARSAITSMTRTAASRGRDFPAGTPWSEVPDDWCCPDCGVREKIDFDEVDAVDTLCPTRRRRAGCCGTPSSALSTRWRARGAGTRPPCRTSPRSPGSAGRPCTTSSVRGRRWSRPT